MNHRSLLSRATEGTDAPTPGYLYVDLAKAASGNPAACQDMAKYLSGRLSSKNNANIKFKCCKVIAKLCDQVPRNAFRRCIAQDHEAIQAIKEAMNYRGTMDPVRGDEPNQRVRIAAKEALDAVYRETSTSEMNTSAPGGYGGSGGISSSYGAPPHQQYSGGGGIPGARRMEGIGNPMFQDPRLDPRYNGENPTGIKGVVKEAGEIITGMIKDPLARNIPVPGSVPNQGHSGNLPGYGSGSGYGRPPPGASELSRQTGGQWTMASNRGPVAVGPDYSNQQQQWSNPASNTIRTGGVGGSWGAADHTASSQQQQSYSARPSLTINSIPGASSGSGGAAVSDGTYERNLVLELCPPGGMKPVPPPDKLANFERACATLNSDLICPVLLDCLEEGQPWVIRAKALCVMETCISSGTRMTDGTNPYRDFFHACQDEIVPLVSHPRAAIRDPAKRVLLLLGIAVDGPVQPVQAPPQVEAPNLLDFGDDNITQNVVAAAPASQPPPPPSEAPPPPPSTVTTPGSMFGGMQVKSAASSSVAPTPAPPAATFSLLDFDTSVPTSNDSNQVVASTQSTADMFGQLTIKDSTTEGNMNGHSNDLTTISSGGSAFGFINATASTEEGIASPGSPSKPIFDPLKTGTPNSGSQQKKTMQMSPEQMQAIAYQQMMMQQQYQQMQMAMAMQQANQFHHPSMVPMHPPLGTNVNMGLMPQAAAMANMNMRFAPAGPVPSAFSFSTAPKPAQKDDKKFDFVKDAMSSANKK